MPSPVIGSVRQGGGARKARGSRVHALSAELSAIGPSVVVARIDSKLTIDLLRGI